MKILPPAKRLFGQLGQVFQYVKEVGKEPVPPKPKWEILGPFGPGEMPSDLQAQWDELKRTGIGPGHPDF
jgi:hypothetical protein